MVRCADCEIERFPGETTRFIGVEARRRHVHILRNIRILNELDRFYRVVNRPPREQSDRDTASTAAEVTRTLFGLRAFEARPEIEARRRRAEQRRLRRQRRSAGARELPGGVEAIDVLLGAESDTEGEK